MRTLINNILMFYILFFAISCMDFGWKSQQLGCATNDPQCPYGFYCDESDNFCYEGVDPGSNSDTDTDSDTDDVECEYNDDCATAQCGSVSCNEASKCVYTADDDDCNIVDGECFIGDCVVLGGDKKPSCKFKSDLYACNAGEICSGEDLFVCEPGQCGDGSIGNEQKICIDDQVAGYVSVVATKDGFAAVWQDKFTTGYGRLNFSRFDSAGTQIDASVTFRPHAAHPTLVWLGDNNGFAVVYQDWISCHEIVLVFLDSLGAIVDGPIQISDDNAADARWPHMSLGNFNGNDMLGIVWSDKRDSVKVEHDIYGAVYNMTKGHIVEHNGKTNQMLIASDLDSAQAKIVAITSKSLFVAAVETFGQIETRAFSILGSVEGDQPQLVAPAGKSYKPIALAYDEINDQIAIAWRDKRLASEFKTMIRLLDNEGAIVGNINDGLIVGPALDLYLGSFYMRPGISLIWTADNGGQYVIAWDGVMGEPSGDFEQSDVFLTFISSDLSQIDVPWTICDLDTACVRPSLAKNQSSYFIAWYDERTEVLNKGNIYSNVLSCKK